MVDKSSGNNVGWEGEVYDCLTNVDEADRKVKSKELATALSEALTFSLGFSSANELSAVDLKDVSDLARKLIRDLQSFEFARKQHKFIDQYLAVVTGIKTKTPGGLFNLSPIISGMISLYEALKEEKKMLKPGPDNRISLRVCITVCQVYEMVLGKAPGCYATDRISESGDIFDGTPYERLCALVERRYALSLPWATRRKAAKTYMKHYNPYKFDMPAIHGLIK